MEQVLEKAKSTQQFPRWIVMAAALLVTSMFVFLFQHQSNLQYPESLRGVLYPEPLALNEFTLLDHNKQPFGKVQLSNHWTFLFFGYTHCPDVCPATLSQLVNLNDRLGKSAAKQNAQFVLVSVDPQRDTPESLAQYIRYFNEGFIALTGRMAVIEQLEQQLGTFHRYEDKNKTGDYAVTHSTEIFLVDPSARVVASFRPPLETNEVARQFVEIIDFQFQANSKT